MKESRRLAIAILSTVALLIACTAIPILISRHFHPAAGCVVAVISLVAWAKLIRPIPGFIQSVVAIWGIVAILGILVVCVAQLLRQSPA